MKKQFTVFYYQVNRTNYQVLAETEQAALKKADKLFKRDFEIPLVEITDGWIKQTDGEDK